MKTCVITFGHNRSWYPACINRLKMSFIDNGYEGDFKAYDNEADLGCPKHTDNPYTFKAYALCRAYADGYDRVIWCDASIKLVKPYSVISERLDDKGYMLFKNGWTTGEWCADSALELLGITREESFDIPHLTSSCMGFDFPKCDGFMQMFYEHANNGAFKGAWWNDNNELSQDPRVLGHRHDQTSASVIAYKLGFMDWIDKGVHYDETPGKPIPETAIFTLRHGM